MTLKELKSSIQLPVIAAPMFIVSGTEMVIESCKNGIVGTFPSLNGRTAEDFEKMLQEITSALKKFEEETGEKPAPFGVNLIVHKSNSRLKTDTQLCKKYKVPLVITSLGAVKGIVEEIHHYGGLVFHDIIKKRHAEKAAEAGVDGIICVSAGAGGHAGTAHPFALIKEVKQFYNGAIILAGSLSTGNDILAAQLVGADFAYMGTRFIATKECKAPNTYKEMILNSGIDDVIYTDGVSGVYGNFLSQSIEKSGLVLEQKKKEDFSKISNNEAKAWKDIWSAGHGVTEIEDIPTIQSLVNKLKSEYKKALEKAHHIKENLKP